MNNSQISVRYAKAIFLSALEEKKLDKIILDVILLEDSYKVEGFGRILESPIVKTSVKKKLVSDVFKSEIDILTFNFLMLILSNKRENYINNILRNLKDLYKKNKGIKSAELTLATEINDEYRKKFLELLSKTFNAKIELVEKIKPGIIGGFILKVEDEQYDASVSTGLAKIKKKLLQTTTR